MANPFTDEKAPYIVVLLIGLVGWMFNSAIETAKNLRVIQYRYEEGKDQAVDTVTIHVANNSMASSINAGDFVFRCPTTSGAEAGGGCLEKIPSINAEAQYVGGAQFGLPEPLQISVDGVRVAAMIPPKTEVGFKIGLKDKRVRPTFSYVLDADAIAGDKSNLQVRIIGPNEVDGGLGHLIDRVTIFVISNYLATLVSALLILFAIVVLYLVVSGVSAVCSIFRKLRDASEW